MKTYLSMLLLAGACATGVVGQDDAGSLEASSFSGHNGRDLETERHSAAFAAGAVDQKFTGHYYLRGVMETGSELLLKKDGSFAWYLAVGALDQTADGQWVRDGDFLLLHVPTQIPNAPIASLAERRPWDHDAERRLMAHVQWQARVRAEERCPYAHFNVVVDAATPAVPFLPGTETPKMNISPAQIEAAADDAADARKEAEIAMALAASQAPNDMALDDAAIDAAMKWNEANWKLSQLREEAGLGANTMAGPMLPLVCQWPQKPDEAEEIESQWQRGIEIKLTDPENKARYRYVKITLRYADGSEGNAITDDDASAVFLYGAGKSADEVRISADWLPDGQDVVLPMPPMEAGVQNVLIPSSGLNRPPFTSMRLRIDGSDLLPDLIPRGRYVRPDREDR